MFDIGWSELLVVLVVALVVVGPKDLPRLMRTVGRWVGKARGMADQFRQSFDEMARETELDELRKEIQALRSNNPVTRLRDEITQSIGDVDIGRIPPPAATAGEAVAEDEFLPPPAGAEEAAAAKEPAPAEEPPVDIHAEPEPELPDAHKAPLPPGYDPRAPE